MDYLRQLWTPSVKEITSSEQSDEDVYPLHMLDDTKTLRGIVVTWTLHFDDVLDPELLKHSLERLLEIGDWKKLGGRLRMNVRRPFVDRCKKCTKLKKHREMEPWSCMFRDRSQHSDPPLHIHVRISTVQSQNMRWQNNYLKRQIVHPFSWALPSSVFSPLAAMPLPV